MYLIALDNIDYIVITVFFALLFGVAYKIRDARFVAPSLSSIVGNIGIIELVVLGMLGALFGFQALITILMAIIMTECFEYVYFWLFLRKSLAYGAITRSDAIVPSDLRMSKFFGIINISIAVFKLLCLIILASITILITYKLLYSLLGWNFVNSIVDVFGFTLIYVIVGGGRGIYYNWIIQLVLTYATLLLVTWLALYKLGGTSVIMHSLRELALKEHLNVGYYVKFDLFLSTNLMLFFGVIFYRLFLKWLGSTRSFMYCIINQNPVILKYSSIARGFSLPLRLIGALLIVSTGIIAIATPINTNSDTGSSGDQIITYQAQLSDGQVGYVVQALGGNLNRASVIPGIIPPVIDSHTSMVILGKYDYFLAFTIMVKHYLNYLPKNFMVLLTVLVLAMFMYSFSGYLLSAVNLIMQNILCQFDKCDIFMKSNTVNVLWVSRICVVGVAVVALLGAIVFNHIK